MMEREARFPLEEVSACPNRKPQLRFLFMALTPGHKRLKKWVRESPRKRSAGRLAAFLGVSRPAVSSWLRGETRPDCRYWPALQLVTGIPVHEWISIEEHQELEDARQKLAAGSPFHV